jgi:hypothetical protein
MSCHPLILSLSYHCADLSLSHRASWLLHRLSSHRPLVVPSLRALPLSCSGWLLRQLSSLHPLVLSSCHSLVLSLRVGWLLRGLHQTMPPPPAIERTTHHRYRHRRHYRHCCCHHRRRHHHHHHHHHRYHRCQTCRCPLPKKEARAAAPPAYQWQHQGVNVYKSGLI